MKISLFSQYLSLLDKTSKRLEITTILSELINKLNKEEIDKAIYLSSGYLRAPYENIKFNMAEKMMLRALEQAYSTKDNLNISSKINSIYKKEGDLGNVAFELAKDKVSEEIEIIQVHKHLEDIAKEAGPGSQDYKVNKTAELLKRLDKNSAKYIVRIILGLIRLGFTELTIISALAEYLGNKKYASEIEKKYNIHPDIGLIAKIIKQKGIKGLDEIKIETGVPVLSQKAQRVSGMEEAMKRIKNVWAEFKFDGTRVQLHLDRDKYISGEIQNSLFDTEDNKILIRTYTRNLEETTHQYPDIVLAADKQIRAQSIILDGEAIGFNKKTGEFLPFQETIQRKRKHDIEETAKNIPLKYYVFDILFLNGQSLIDKTLRERRKILDKIIDKGDTIIVDEHLETDRFEDLKKYYETAKEKKLEGLIAKNPEDMYQAGARSYSWIKLKSADEKLLKDSIDCVVLGYYYGKGVRSKFGIGGFLVGIYDEKENNFKTITKIGTGLTEEDWGVLKKMADKLKVGVLPKNIIMNKIFTPDILLSPEIIVEIGADEISVSPSHTAGYALRFPRLLKFRADKKPTEITTLNEIKSMFKNQPQRKK
ncbi:MAG TPA: ATP-dependent DNA ligase [bacterium]|jgi:DNA ligase-1|nr:ATP-dependent DNA ligase [bacterium]